MIEYTQKVILDDFTSKQYGLALEDARILAQRLLREFESQADDASCRWGVLGRGCSHWRSDICRVSHP